MVEHLEYPRKLLREAGRVAKLVFVEVPLDLTFRSKDDYVETGVGHINIYSRRTIRWLVETSGFQVVQQIVTNHSKNVYMYLYGKKAYVLFPVSEVLLKLSPRIATSLLVYHSALLCRRVSESTSSTV